ncbi:CBS domain-containing protein [Paraglaciecola aquimarina]|uniref:CBS domain-containing protein n=1 Tax=Paraglaciecola aquimarina TaxID=1235557 RepID=A0ABU3SYA5_9ALTE|nr:CBS domain-containing protein [Paraglaciecola aquimarina]MDU0354980.1 CBS domain-containing protein [Paraglaciecola aquimarina]
MVTEQNVSENIKHNLRQMTVSQIMSDGVLTVYEGWSIRRLSKFFIKHNISGAPVIAADDELVGVVTQSDIIRFESHEPSESEIEKLVTQFCGPFGGTIDKSEIKRIQDKANDYCAVNSINDSQRIFSNRKHKCLRGLQLNRKKPCSQIVCYRQRHFKRSGHWYGHIDEFNEALTMLHLLYIGKNFAHASQSPSLLKVSELGRKLLLH